jgi:O-antigen/teichoic acid export membrane protein
MLSSIYVLSVLNTFIKSVSAFLIGVILANRLDLSEYGSLYYYIQLVNFSGVFFSLGLGQSLLFRLKKNLISSTRVYSFTLIHILVVSSIFGLILVIIKSDYIISLILAFSLYVGVNIVSFLKMRDKVGVKRNLYASIISSIFHLGAIYAFMILDRLSLIVVLLSFVFAFALKLVLVMPDVKLKMNFHYDLTEYKYSLPFFANTILLTGLLRLDIFVLNYYLPESEIAIYAVTLNIAEIALLLPSAIGSVLFPLILSSNDSGPSRKEGRMGLLLNSVFAVAIALVLFFVANDLIIFFYGESYERSSGYIFLLLPGIVALSGVYSTSNTLSALGKVKYTSIALLGGLALNIIILVLGVKTYGLAIAPLSSSIAYSLVALVLFIGLKKYKL